MSSEKKSGTEPDNLAPKTDESGRPKRLDGSSRLALIAIAISLIGTGVAIVEAYLLREQQTILSEEKAASVWPYVQVIPSISYGEDGVTITTHVENKGVGPALLGDVDYTFDGKTYNSWSMDDAVSEKYPNLELHMNGNFQIDSLVLSAREVIRLFSFSVENVDPDKFSDTANQIVNLIEVTFCYCSVYGDCWWRGPGRAPVRGKDCKPIQ